ncbi:hypothetical protein ACFOYU_25655 [Microvirga sp. GCM10011540]|uniref:hypothetical protein n=1 Tax=Microvirga sp. GCM10011540 TaxID=3317338 RepID=UPI0036176DE3
MTEPDTLPKPTEDPLLSAPLAVPSPAVSRRNATAAKSPELREKLSPARVTQLRELVEGTTKSYKRIGAELGVSPSTISRYATDGEWRRPPGAALPARIARHRDKTTEKLWKLTARHVEALEEQDVELTRRSLQPLASLTRALGALTPAKIPAAPLEPGHDASPEKPTRTIHELRDELAAHLERIEREEAEYWDRHAWHFENGAGI